MAHKFVLAIFMIFPTLLFSQKDIWDSSNKGAFKEYCHEKIFEKVEETPSLKVSKESYADSIEEFLQQRQISLKNKKAVFRLIVTSKPEIFNLAVLFRDVSTEEAQVLEDAILKYPDLWMPARQNSHIVCSYVNLELEFTKNKLNIRIFQ